LKKGGSGIRRGGGRKKEGDSSLGEGIQKGGTDRQGGRKSCTVERGKLGTKETTGGTEEMGTRRLRNVSCRGTEETKEKRRKQTPSKKKKGARGEKPRPDKVYTGGQRMNPRQG